MINESKKKATFHDLLIRPFYVNKRDYFISVMEKLDMPKDNNLIRLDSSDSANKKREEFQECNLRQNEIERKMPIKHSQVVNMPSLTPKRILKLKDKEDQESVSQSQAKSVSMFNNPSPAKSNIKRAQPT